MKDYQIKLIQKSRAYFLLSTTSLIAGPVPIIVTGVFNSFSIFLINDFASSDNSSKDVFPAQSVKRTSSFVIDYQIKLIQKIRA